MGTKNNPGEFDCYEAAEPDEPMFVLLARDPLAAELVELWADMRAAKVDHHTSKKVSEARVCAANMRDWRGRKWRERVAARGSVPPHPENAEAHE